MLLFQMACILKPECNFLHAFFRCHLLIEALDIEVKITSMQGTHVFRRDRTSHLIKCTQWSTRLCPHPTIIKKISRISRETGSVTPVPKYPVQTLPTRHQPHARKGGKVTEKEMRLAPTKRFKTKITAKPNSDGATMRPPVIVSKAPTNLESKEGTPENKPPPLEDAPIHAGTPWPKAGKMSGNLFQIRKDWLIPPNYDYDSNTNIAIANSSKSPIKIEPKPEEQPTNSPIAEKCGWGPNCPFCKNIEDWDGDHQKQLQQQPQPQVQMPQMQCPQALHYQKP